MLRDDELNVIVEFEPAIWAKWYSCPDEIVQIPWLVGIQVPHLEPNQNIVVLIRGRDAGGLAHELASDIDVAGERALQSIGDRVFHTVCHSISMSQAYQVIRDGCSSNVLRLIKWEFWCVQETTSTLDAEVRKRFASSRIMRE